MPSTVEFSKDVMPYIWGVARAAGVEPTHPGLEAGALPVELHPQDRYWFGGETKDRPAPRSGGRSPGVGPLSCGTRPYLGRIRGTG